MSLGDEIQESPPGGVTTSLCLCQVPACSPSIPAQHIHHHPAGCVFTLFLLGDSISSNSTSSQLENCHVLQTHQEILVQRSRVGPEASFPACAPGNAGAGGQKPHTGKHYWEHMVEAHRARGGRHLTLSAGLAAARKTPSRCHPLQSETPNSWTLNWKGLKVLEGRRILIGFVHPAWLVLQDSPHKIQTGDRVPLY